MAERDGQEVDWLDTVVRTVRGLHSTAISRSGGLEGVHEDKLYSACARPFHTMFGEELYPTPPLKAAALLHGIISGHVFVDGNKRTGVMAAVGLLIMLGAFAGNVSDFEARLLGELAVEVAGGHSMSVDEVADWLMRILHL